MLNKDEFEMINKMNIGDLARQAKEDLDVVDEDENVYGEILDEEYEDLDQEQEKQSEHKDKVEYQYDYGQEYDTVSIPTIDEYEEEIFPGGPTKTQVDVWKKDFDGYGIYVIEVAEKPFVIRTINRLEYKQIIALPNIDALLREEIICSKSVLWPVMDFESLATYDAGIPSSVAQIVMDKSGFTKDYAIQVL